MSTAEKGGGGAYFREDTVYHLDRLCIELNAMHHYRANIMANYSHIIYNIAGPHVLNRKVYLHA